MPGRRGARSGRGWDAIPPRPPGDGNPPGDEPRDGDRERGNVPGRRRGSSGNFSPAIGGSGTTGGSGRRYPSRGRGRSGSTSSFGDPDGAGRSASGDPDQAGRAPSGDRDQAGRFPSGGRERADGSDRLARGRSGSAGDGPSGFFASDQGGLFGDRAGGSSSERAGRSFGDQAGGASGERSGGRGGRPAEPPRSESERAREICLNQLAVRPRTRAELAKVLTRKEISDEVIAEVLDRYDEVGIIDDAAFARAWVSTRHQGRGLARRALADELRRRGVDAEVAAEALETVDDESEAETARALVDRKLRTATGAPDAVFRRLVGMLARKGYPPGVAIRAVKDALAARDAEAAEFADGLDADALADESLGDQTGL